MSHPWTAHRWSAHPSTAQLWIAFFPYIVVSGIHVTALALGAAAVAAPTKVLLMPFLALAVVWGSWGTRWMPTHTILVTAIGLSWLGDSIGTVAPWLPTLPMMLLFFGLAHLCYIPLLWRMLSDRRLPAWSVVYALWWGVLIGVLWPHLGGLLAPVAIYGLVLGATAAASARCHPLITVGGALFLASDTILAFRLFLPGAMPDFTSPLVMVTYTLGQGLIAAGAVTVLRRRAVVPEHRTEAIS